MEARYEATIAEWLAGGSPGRSEAGILIVELIAKFHEHCLEYYGPDASHIDRIKAPLRDLRRLYGDMPARDFGRECGWRGRCADAWTGDVPLAAVENDPAFSWVPELGAIAIDDSTTFSALGIGLKVRARIADSAR